MTRPPTPAEVRLTAAERAFVAAVAGEDDGTVHAGIQVATVAAGSTVGNVTATFDDGTTITGLHHSAAYTPTVGDVVTVLTGGGQALILDKIR